MLRPHLTRTAVTEKRKRIALLLAVEAIAAIIVIAAIIILAASSGTLSIGG